MKFSPAVSAELVELVSQRTKRARVAITGTSMEPLLTAGMVVDIEPLTETPRIGDILVFRSQRGLVAHRLVGGERFTFRAHSGIIAHPHAAHAAAYVTGGDAYPDRTEVVPAELVIGRVVAVWTSAAPNAQRVDNARYLRTGTILARSRKLRSLAAKVRAYIALIVTDPRRVTPPAAFAALLAATRMFERRDYAGAVSRLESVPHQSTIDMARRHHASGLLSQWLDEAARAGITVPRDLHDAFHRIRWTNALQAGRVLACVRDVRDIFASAEIPHIFLKGGARLAADEPAADLQFSGDLDVLVPAHLAERALSALRGAGYWDVRPEHERAAYAALHHREPLRSPQVDVPVEIHVALTPPAIVTRSLDYAALVSSSRRVAGPAGDVDVLDAVGSAVHLAYHARDLQVWRDIVLLSRLLRRFDGTERGRFDTYVRAERRDGLRLASAVAAADGLTSDTMKPARAIQRYLAWAELREDLPRGFAHVEFMEAIAGRCPIHIFHLDHTQRDLATWVRCWARNLAVLPFLLRLVLRRTAGRRRERVNR